MKSEQSQTLQQISHVHQLAATEAITSKLLFYKLFCVLYCFFCTASPLCGITMCYHIVRSRKYGRNMVISHSFQSNVSYYKVTCFLALNQKAALWENSILPAYTVHAKWRHSLSSDTHTQNKPRRLDKNHPGCSKCDTAADVIEYKCRRCTGGCHHECRVSSKHFPMFDTRWCSRSVCSRNTHQRFFFFRLPSTICLDC